MDGLSGAMLDLNLPELVFWDVHELRRGALQSRLFRVGCFLVGPPDGRAQREQKKASSQEASGFHGLSPPPPGNQAESDDRKREYNDAEPERGIQPAAGHIERAVFSGLRADGDQILVR